MVKPCVRPRAKGSGLTLALKCTLPMPSTTERSASRSAWIAARSVAGTSSRKWTKTQCRIIAYSSRRLVALEHGRRQRLAAENEIGALLANHDGRRVGVGGRHARHHRGVADAQAF